MTVTPTSLTRAAAACAVAAGVIFVGVQVGHPHLDAGTVATTDVVVRDVLKVCMAALALAGITGVYLNDVRRSGIAGLVGYLALATGYLLILATTFAAAFVLPEVVDTERAWVDDVLTVVSGGSATGDVGPLGTVLQVQGALYLVGGLVLGVALYRAGVLARWACLLLAAGGPVTALLSVMPDALYRLLAVPNGVALVGLGVSLWQAARRPAVGEPSAEPVGALG